MANFLIGVASGLATAAIVWLCRLMPAYVRDVWLYRGVRIDGVWDIYEVNQDGKPKSMPVGKLTIRQKGARLTGESYRTKTRDGKPSDRRFTYGGRIAGEQVTLLYDDARGQDFDPGTYVFRLHNDCITMQGMATFFGRPENRIVAERRTLKKSGSPLPG